MLPLNMPTPTGTAHSEPDSRLAPSRACSPPPVKTLPPSALAASRSSVTPTDSGSDNHLLSAQGALTENLKQRRSNYRMDQTVAGETVAPDTQVQAHLDIFIAAYNFGKRLKTIHDITP